MANGTLTTAQVGAFISAALQLPQDGLNVLIELAPTASTLPAPWNALAYPAVQSALASLSAVLPAVTTLSNELTAAG